MKACILGSSNVLVNGGLVQGLRSSNCFEQVHCIGAGGSSSVIHIFEQARVDFSDYDIVMLETSITDGHWLDSGFLHVLDVVDYLTTFVYDVIRSGAEPVFVMMPRQERAMASALAQRIHRSFAQRFDCKLFDGYQFVAGYSHGAGLDYKSFFADKYHLEPKFAAKFGQRIAQDLREALDPKRPHRTANGFPGTAYTYRVVPIDQVAAGLPVIERKTSQRVDRFLPLQQPNDRISLILEASEQLCGFKSNSRISNGVLLLEGAGGIVRKLISTVNQMRVQREFTRHLTIFETVNRSDRLLNRVSISLGDEHDAQHSELEGHPLGITPSESGRLWMAEIGDLLIRKPTGITLTS